MPEETERSLQMLAAALEKEEKGRDFYKQAMDKCTNPLGRELFRSLVADEGVHIVRIKEIYESLRGGKVWNAEWKSHTAQNEDLRQLVRARSMELGPRITAETSDLEAVDIGIQMESGAIAFYQDQRAKAVDELEKDFADIMLAEERNHLRGLEDLKLYFTNPESWLLEMEKPTLDGA